MITRLQIDGFKNLVKTDIRFGPFTCIAGTNAVGKSNLFDAIRFLSDLSSKTLVDAAATVRGNSKIRDLFHRTENTLADRISFSVEMIIPKEGVDEELGQAAEATITTVRYELVLAYRKNYDLGTQGVLEILREELAPIAQREAHKNISFYPDLSNLNQKEQNVVKKREKVWKHSVIQGRRSAMFISTEGEGEERKINFHQDGGSSGKPAGRKASNLPRTILSTANALENPTALIVKNEMQSWKMLQLEPNALRSPDDFRAVNRATLSTNGSHLPATLYRLQNDNSSGYPDIRQHLANRLFELIGNVAYIDIDRDDKRELLTLMLRTRDNTVLPAMALSDGTLRFLGLSVLEADARSGSVICLEEPENGIHPEKISSILRILQDIATDVNYPVDEDNPLRQVITNTHSPLVVQQVPEDSLLMAELRESVDNYGNFFKRAVYIPLDNTWRTRLEKGSETTSLGHLLAYLNPTRKDEFEYDDEDNTTKKIKRRVMDREDVQEIQHGQLSLFYES